MDDTKLWRLCVEPFEFQLVTLIQRLSNLWLWKIASENDTITPSQLLSHRIIVSLSFTQHPTSPPTSERHEELLDLIIERERMLKDLNEQKKNTEKKSVDGICVIGMLNVTEI